MIRGFFAILAVLISTNGVMCFESDRPGKKQSAVWALYDEKSQQIKDVRDELLAFSVMSFNALMIKDPKILTSSRLRKIPGNDFIWGLFKFAGGGGIACQGLVMILYSSSFLAVNTFDLSEAINRCFKKR